MGRLVRIPVRVVQPSGEATRSEAFPASQPLAFAPPAAKSPLAEAQSPEDEPLAGSSIPGNDTAAHRTGPQSAEMDWCDRALRLQAEMENYRKRQQRLAQEQVEAERQRLLRGFLRVVDDLERALAAPAGDGRDLRHGLELTHRAALHILATEGVERVQPENQPFDPTWQEAVSAIDHEQVHAAPDTVVQVLEPGYRLQGHLLRPAKVVVAM